jgi:two-component system response regulator LytT
MQIIIIEDEKPAARLLKRRVEKLGYPVQQLLHSVTESIEWLQNNEHPDLVFMDIQLSDGLSFEILNSIELKSSIIFTTAYDEYVLKAFKHNSVDYLLKPVDEEELKFAINKFLGLQQPKQTFDLTAIKELLTPKAATKYRERFSVKVGTNIKLIETSQIECFFSENKVSFVHTKENKNFIVDFTLDALEMQLNPKKFFRINRSQIIQLNAIKEITVYSNSRLRVILHSYNREEMIVSREKVNDFKDWLEAV